MFCSRSLHSTTRGLRGDEERLSQGIALQTDEGDAAKLSSDAAMCDGGSTFAGSGMAGGGMALAERWSGAAACMAAAAARGVGMPFSRSGAAAWGSGAAFSGSGTPVCGSGIKPSREKAADDLEESRDWHGKSDTSGGERYSRGPRSCAGGTKRRCRAAGSASRGLASKCAAGVCRSLTPGRRSFLSLCCSQACGGLTCRPTSLRHAMG